MSLVAFFASVTLFLVLRPSALRAQDEPCMKEVRAVLEQVGHTLEEQDALWGELQITTVSADRTRPSVEKLQQGSGNDRLVTENDHFTLFQDQEHRVLVMHLDKEVFIYDQPKGIPPPSFERWANGNERVFQVAQLSVCRKVHGSGADRIEATLQLPTDDVSGMQEVTYAVDPALQRLISLHIRYRKGQPHRSRTILYRSLVPGRLDSRLERSALANVLTSGKPRAEFAQHTINDLRDKAPRKQPSSHVD
ncbi:MAG TPA: hypothetical protein VGE21_15240 [Flavobacteriales bacterium]